VRNLGDGSVEAVAEGPADAMSQFKAALERGPSYSHVTSVSEIEAKPTGQFNTFDVIY
jgi:acylphosphatase